MTQLRPLLTAADARLEAAEVPSATRDARLLLAHAWEVSVAELQRREVLGQELPAAVERRFEELVEHYECIDTRRAAC